MNGEIALSDSDQPDDLSAIDDPAIHFQSGTVLAWNWISSSHSTKGSGRQEWNILCCVVCWRSLKAESVKKDGVWLCSGDTQHAQRMSVCCIGCILGIRDTPHDRTVGVSLRSGGHETHPTTCHWLYYDVVGIQDMPQDRALSVSLRSGGTRHAHWPSAGRVAP